MEIGELIAPPVPHFDENEDCPFCPKEEKPTDTTIPGLKNSSSALKENMNDPDAFGKSKEGKARPKPALKKERKEKLKEPEPIGTHPDPTIGEYSCEPHHLISGKQALAKNDEHEFEQWIKASHGTIEADTGYSVNNYDNGLWMPSVPENTKGKAGAWAKLDRQAVANHIMEATGRQFHKGGHNIPETRIDSRGKRVKVPKDEQLHMAYDKFLIKKLETMNERMKGWSDECPLCRDHTDKTKEKFQPSVRVNEALDRLSARAEKHITGDRKGWTLFISSLAFIYHDEVCECEHGEKNNY